MPWEAMGRLVGDQASALKKSSIPFLIPFDSYKKEYAEKCSLSGLIKKALRKLDWKALKRKTVVPLLGIIICW